MDEAAVYWFCPLSAGREKNKAQGPTETVDVEQVGERFQPLTLGNAFDPTCCSTFIFLLKQHKRGFNLRGNSEQR